MHSQWEDGFLLTPVFQGKEHEVLRMFTDLHREGKGSACLISWCFLTPQDLLLSCSVVVIVVVVLFSLVVLWYYLRISHDCVDMFWEVVDMGLLTLSF